MSGSREAELAGRLEEIAEQIADLAIDALRAAIEAGSDKRPADERRLTSARRSVEKAAHLLRGAPTAATEE